MALSFVERQVLAGLAICAVVVGVFHEVSELKQLGTAIQGQLLEDHYVELGVAETAQRHEIFSAFKRSSSKLASRPQDEAFRNRHAVVARAYDVLSKPESRAAYDRRRRLVRFASNGIGFLCVGLPVILVCCLLLRVVRAFAVQAGAVPGVDPKTFEGRLAASLCRLEGAFTVVVDRGDPSAKLGLQLGPAPRAALRLGAISESGVVARHNAQVMVNEGLPEHGLAPWTTSMLQVGEDIVSVNGVFRPPEMMRALQAEERTLTMVVRRPLLGMHAWVTEMELTRASAAERWGCRVAAAKDGSDSLEVRGVDDSGVVARWNSMNPPFAVRVGDRVVSVNRHLDSKTMLAALQDSSSMSSSWVLCRGLRDQCLLPDVIEYGPFERRGDGQKLGIRIGQALQSPVRGAILEKGCVGAVVVKEILPGYVVHDWNQRVAPGERVLEGSTIVAINGQTDSRQFHAELRRPSVMMTLRPPRGALPPRRSGAQRLLALPAENAPRPWARLLFGRWAPSFLLPRSYEARLRDSLSRMRCEFTVHLSRPEAGAGKSSRFGLDVKSMRDACGGLLVEGIDEDGIVGRYNAASSDARRQPVIRRGDRLVSANGATSSAMILEMLGNAANTTLELIFVRKASEAAPGVWEAEIEKPADDGWGLQLRVQDRFGGPGAVVVDRVEPGLVVDRWNQRALAQGRWPIEVGDLVVGVEPEVSHPRMVDRLKAGGRAKFTLLRWHCGPAPESGAEALPQDGQTLAAPAPQAFEVVLHRSTPCQRLGIRLDPSRRDPTRTLVSEVVAGGVVEAHNLRVLAEVGASQATAASPPPTVCAGDEVESINGERDPTRFASRCSENPIRLRLLRRTVGGSAPTSQAPAPAAALEANGKAHAPPPTPAPVPPQAPLPAAVGAGAPPVAAKPPPDTASAPPQASAPPPVAAPAPAAAPPPSVPPPVAQAALPEAVPPPAAGPPFVAPEREPAQAQESRAEVEELRASLSAARAESASSSSALAAAREEVCALQAEAAELRQANQRLERAGQAERRTAREEADALHSQVAELQRQAADLQRRLAHQSAEGCSREERLSAENRRLQAELSAARAANAAPSRGVSMERRLDPLADHVSRLAALSASLLETMGED